MPRVALVATSYPASSLDGAGCFVRAEALARRDEGYDCHVIVPGPACADPGLTVYDAGGSAAFGWPGAVGRIRQRPWRAGPGLAFVASASRTLRRLAPDRIDAHWWLPSAWPIAESCRSAHLVAIAHGADVRLLCRLPCAARESAVRRLLARGAELRFVAAALRDQLLERLPSDLARAALRASFIEPCCLFNVEPRSRPDSLRAELGLASAAHVFIVGGRLIAEKRIDLALDLVAARPASVLLVAGDGPERKRLRPSPPRTRWLGHLARPRFLEVLAGCDALLHPSDVDAAPTVVREARRLGVPVASRGAGDVGAWAERDPGIAVAGRLEDALAELGLA
ncbi:MAG: glycosyltransferase family 4 protein [Myxococcota bacterium]